MTKISSALLVLCLLSAPMTFAKGKGSKQKKAEMTRLCKEENPDATNKAIKKCVREKMKKNKKY